MHQENYANDVCLIELGYPTVAGRIRTMQSKLVTKLIEERKNMDSDPFNYVWQLCCREGTKAAKYIREIQAASDHTADDVAKVKRRVVNSTGTKFVTHRTDINPIALIHILCILMDVRRYENITA